jgi:hypothetical protein
MVMSLAAAQLGARRCRRVRRPEILGGIWIANFATDAEALEAAGLRE